MDCPACRASLPEEALFCLRCGARALEPTGPEPEDPIRAALRKALGQQYEIQRLLGRGGMGAVYLATEAALEREVAIKVLPPNLASTQESRDRFKREARTAARLSHPNIVPLHTFGDVDGVLYFVMGYVKGESLAARLKRDRRLPVEESRRILIEIAAALDHAHQLGIIHRDIKPDNVLLEAGSGRAMLLDFGVAKAVGVGQTMTELGSVLGTPQYMSPEQAQGKADIDHRTDLYSLGVMGYAMLAGRLPFEGPTPGEVMAQHITREAPPLKSLAPDMPVEIATALMRCLAKEPGKRWPDARSLQQAIATTGDDETPPQLEGIGGFLMGLLIGSFLLLCFGAWWLGGGLLPEPLPIFPRIVAAVTLLLVLVFPLQWLSLRRAGFDSQRILRQIMGPVQLWPGWHPRRFRQPGDVWDRLPPELRQLRLAVGWSVVVSAMTLPLFTFEMASISYVTRTGTLPYGIPLGTAGGWVRLLVLPAFAIAVGLALRFELFCRRRGCDAYTSSRLIGTPTFKRAFWSKPEIAAFLLPSNSSAATASSNEPATPSGLADAVVSLARGLPESRRTIGDEAREAARRLGDSVSALDKQIAALDQAFDSEEPRRIAARIAVLEVSAPAADENREVREILRRQLEPLSVLSARLDGLKALRARRGGMLRSLWLHVTEMTAAANDSDRLGHSADRLRELLAEIGRGIGGSALTQQVDAAITESPTLER